MKFQIETHRSKPGNIVAQVVLADQVLWEETGISESQAVANVKSSFANLLASVLERESEVQAAEFEEADA